MDVDVEQRPSVDELLEMNFFTATTDDFDDLSQ